METNPSADSQEQGGEEITVDLDQSDASKAVTRTRNRGSINARGGKGKNGKAGDDVDDWAEKSKEVQKRIGRVTRSFEQQMADQEARHQREIAAVREEMGRLNGRREEPTNDDAAHERKMDQLEAEYQAALEEGDSAKAAKKQREMSRVEAEYWAKKTNAAVQGSSEAGGAGKDKGATPTDKRGEPGTGRYAPTKQGLDWANANNHWWNSKSDEDGEAATAYANTLFRRLIDEGEDKNSPAFYEAIGEKVAKRFPELHVQVRLGKRRPADDDEGDEAGSDRGFDPDRRGRAPVVNGGDSTGNPAPRHGPGVRTLNNADQKTMRAMGLDPANNKHVMTFLREKESAGAA